MSTLAPAAFSARLLGPSEQVFGRLAPAALACATIERARQTILARAELSTCDGKESKMAFKSRGVRALVILQMAEMNELFAVWRKAKRLRVKLPATKDPAYANLDLLMRHALRACRGYLTWLCEVLGRPDPKVPDPPEALDVGKKGAAYLRTLERAWTAKMAWMPNSVLDSPDVHASRWGTPMTVEAMLEHALAHPMRHRFQLEELIAKKRKRR